MARRVQIMDLLTLLTYLSHFLKLSFLDLSGSPHISALTILLYSAIVVTSLVIHLPHLHHHNHDHRRPRHHHHHHHHLLLLLNDRRELILRSKFTWSE